MLMDSSRGALKPEFLLLPRRERTTKTVLLALLLSLSKLSVNSFQQKFCEDENGQET